MANAKRSAGRWLLFIHQIPPRPAYLRVKTGRRLSRIGAVPLKNSVYIMPRSEAALEDLQWVRRELVEGGGDASLIDAELIDGIADHEVEALFRDARDAEYRRVTTALRAIEKRFPRKPSARKRAELAAAVARHAHRLEEIAAIDFFGAPARDVAHGVLDSLRRRCETIDAARGVGRASAPELYRKRTWVTRAGIHVDRIASAWLIRRFIDPDARFKFVSEKDYTPDKRELRFDMFEAEFSHEGDACTFEVLCQRLRLHEPGLSAVAEIVHDIDLKDRKFARPETEGIAASITGIALLARSDAQRLERGSRLFDELLAFVASKRD